MTLRAALVVTVFLVVMDSTVCDLDTCEDGYQIARVYTDCWRDSKYTNRTSKMYVPQEEYTSRDVLEYATHMCRVVKPEALKCLDQHFKRCTNIEKILEMADNSGGTCKHNDLDQHFKTAIIDHLPSVKTRSQCFNISDTSKCYDSAAASVRQKGVPISRFHYEADKFFARIWECQVNLYKSNSAVCPNWQIPMLLSLQDMAMPTLFGMKLTEEHVSMLELNNEAYTSKPTPTPGKVDGDNKQKFYILLRVLTQRPETSDGDVVVQVNFADGVQDVKANRKQVTLNDSKKTKSKPSKPPKTRKEKTLGLDQMVN